MRQIINNLVSNAIKFTADGRVELQVTEIANGNENVALRFAVRDSGIGMTNEQREIVFNPFTQADNSTTRNYGGTGFGLSICHKLVGLLGGEIGVESTPDVGSTFWFTVVTERGQQRIAEQTPTSSGGKGEPVIQVERGLRVLVAEDNPLNQKIISWMLAPLGCQFDIVDDGLKALAAVARTLYDIILMDIQMPGVDGITATKQIRSLGGAIRQIPIVAMTANAMQGDREMYLEAGLNAYVPKPIDQRDLLNTITQLAEVEMPTFDPMAKVSEIPVDISGKQAGTEK